VPADGTHVVLHTCDDTTGARSTVLYLRSVCTAPTEEVACNDNDYSCAYSAFFSRLDLALAKGLYWVFVDGQGGTCGDYVLHAEMW